MLTLSFKNLYYHLNIIILNIFTPLKQQGCVPFAKPQRLKPVNQKL